MFWRRPCLYEKCHRCALQIPACLYTQMRRCWSEVVNSIGTTHRSRLIAISINLILPYLSYLMWSFIMRLSQEVNHMRSQRVSFAKEKSSNSADSTCRPTNKGMGHIGLRDDLSRHWSPNSSKTSQLIVAGELMCQQELDHCKGWPERINVLEARLTNKLVYRPLPCFRYDVIIVMFSSANRYRHNFGWIKFRWNEYRPKGPNLVTY